MSMQRTDRFLVVFCQFVFADQEPFCKVERHGRSQRSPSHYQATFMIAHTQLNVIDSSPCKSVIMIHFSKPAIVMDKLLMDLTT
jgi:hypothetical protein